MALYLVVENPGRTNLLPYDIFSFHAAPTQPALGTISHALLDIRRQGEIPRVDVTYSLAPRQQSGTVKITWPEAKAMGLAPRVISDRPPRADEDAELHRDRAVSWLTNHLMPSYQSGLVNTAVVADAVTIKLMVEYLRLRDPTSAGMSGEDRDAGPGAIFKFAPAGFRLAGNPPEYSPKEDA